MTCQEARRYIRRYIRSARENQHAFGLNVFQLIGQPSVCEGVLSLVYNQEVQL